MKSISEYYKILGVDSSVTAEELKKVYRELVKEWHPDRLLHNPSLHKTAQQKLQEINEAYDQLLAHLANPEPRSSPPKNEPRRDTAAGPRKANNPTAKRPVAPATQCVKPLCRILAKASCVGPARGLRHRERSVDHRGFHFHAVVGDRCRLVLATELTLWNRKLVEGSESIARDVAQIFIEDVAELDSITAKRRGSSPSVRSRWVGTPSISISTRKSVT